MKTNGLITDTAAGVVHYENAAIPLRIKEYTIDDTETEQVILHWHDDFELVQILEGFCEYRINDDRLLLQSGDFLFLNTRVMHASRRSGTPVLTARCLLFQPKILTANPLLQEKYIRPVWQENTFEYLYFPRNTSEGREFCSYMNTIYTAKKEERTAYEMEVLACLHLIMAKLFRYMNNIAPAVQQKTYRSDLEKKMLSLIYHKYPEKLTLNDIASSAGVSTHRCCEIFRQYIGFSPIEYLNFYRIEVSARMLTATNDSIQTIANNCGIDSAAYYTKLFKEHFGMTPKAWRRQHESGEKKL